MLDATVLAYVHASAAMLDLPLDAARAGRVALHLGRTAVLAQQLEALTLASEVELAEIFCPANFPAPNDAGSQP